MSHHTRPSDFQFPLIPKWPPRLFTGADSFERIRRWRRCFSPLRAFWVFSLMVLTACSLTIRNVPTEHIVMVNRNGNLVDPTGNRACSNDFEFCNGKHNTIKEYRRLSTERYEPYFKGVTDALSKHPLDLEEREEIPEGIRTPSPDSGITIEPDGKRKILIFIHGGLNTQVSTVKRAAGLHEQIKRAGYFPIFINWQSSLVSTYFDHLLYIRQGKDWGRWGPILSPFYMAGDILRGVGRAPVVWTFQIRNDLASMPIWKQRQKKLNKMAEAPLHRYDPYKNEIDVHLPDQKNPHPDAMAISRGKEKRGNWDKNLSFISYLYTLPIKLISSPFIDAMGKSAWQIMLRRIDLLFHTHGAKKAKKPPPIQVGNPQDADLVNASGPLSAFLTYLGQNLPDDNKTEITLVGHSMGTIVMNRILREFGDELPIRSVVYMAAASSIQDYEQSVFPYLERHPRAQVYHLTLHDTADIRDRWNLFPYFDPPPRGSLLVWIDDFLSDPKTPLDHSLGRFGNTVLSVNDTPEEMKDRIHIKEFSLGGEAKDSHPQRHGDFSTRFMFWKPECWRPNTQPSDVCYSKEVLWD